MSRRMPQLKEWEKMQSEKTEEIIFRAKSQCVEQEEKNIKYLIKALIKPNEILEEERRFYKNLCSTRLPDNHELEKDSPNLLDGQNENIQTLNDIDKQFCDASLKLDVVANILKQLKNDKSPGNDGLISNFYTPIYNDDVGQN